MRKECQPISMWGNLKKEEEAKPQIVEVKGPEGAKRETKYEQAMSDRHNIIEISKALDMTVISKLDDVAMHSTIGTTHIVNPLLLKYQETQYKQDYDRAEEIRDLF